jgi:hypothetical protein
MLDVDCIWEGTVCYELSVGAFFDYGIYNDSLHSIFRNKTEAKVYWILNRNTSLDFNSNAYSILQGLRFYDKAIDEISIQDLIAMNFYMCNIRGEFMLIDRRQELRDKRVFIDY